MNKCEGDCCRLWLIALFWNFIDILGWVSALLEWIITLFWNLLTVSRTYDKLGITTLRLSAKFGQHSLSWQTVKTLHALWECNVAIQPVAIPLKLESWFLMQTYVVCDDWSNWFLHTNPASSSVVSKSIHILCFLHLRNQTKNRLCGTFEQDPIFTFLHTFLDSLVALHSTHVSGPVSRGFKQV